MELYDVIIKVQCVQDLLFLRIIRGGPLDILGGGQKNFLCKNFFFYLEALSEFFFHSRSSARIFFERF